ncbi:MAG: hypothetical protein RML56_06525 [Burkholderiales bacterium]|nr:hypothetical protein [Burkholderiales bacterium]
MSGGVQAVSPTAFLPDRSGGRAFARALRDPRVVAAARALDIDLENPAAVAALLDRARKLIGAAAPQREGGAGALSPVEAAVAADGVRDSYVRHAIQTYRTVARLI